jgi:hypothetical protein
LPHVRTLACILAVPALLCVAPLQAATHVYPVPVPQELRSSAFTVAVNGKAVDVAHAAASYDFANFDITGAVDVEITAAEPGFWDRGVDIEPWRLGLRAQRSGQTIRFRLSGPAKLSISRPRDFLNHASMLFLFAGTPPPAPPKGPNVKSYSPGVYHESLNPKSGDTIYLSPGAYFYGSLNLWQVDNVKVLGRGVIVYEGQQNPDDDDGWMSKPDWHCVDSLEAHHVEIDGLTCVLRSRTWSIQMKNSSYFVYDDLRVIGGNPGNANQDGMDWLGSSNGVVRDSFFRASDDVIALIGNWDGYTEADMLRPGPDVHDILVENSELSTSISNVVRAGWPQKIFNSHGFTLRDSDILHAGIGSCVQHFGLIGFWGANDAKGLHQNYTFENLFLDNWYSLAQLEQEQPALKDFTFRNIWALDQPPMVGSSIKGDISGVTFENVKYGQHVAQNNADLPLTVDAAQQPHYAPSSGPIAAFTLDSPIVATGQKLTFTARKSPHADYTWYFGDGTTGHGRTAHHVFKDADGSDLDGANGAGHFRVMLQVRDDHGREDWAAQGLVVVAKWQDATPTAGPMLAGLSYQIYPGAFTSLPDLKQETAVITGEAPNLNADARGFTKYVVAWDGLLDIPADGGYTFHLMDTDGARIVLDGVEVARTGPPFSNVCGTPGNAIRYDRGSLGLRAGLHSFHVEQLHSVSQGAPRVLWEGPSLPAGEIPSEAYTHPRQDILTAR